MSNGRHTLNISPDWEYTSTRIEGESTFAFHSSGTCPGYSIKISGWRLRKIPGAQITQDELFLRGLDELNRHLGDSVCPGRKGLETLKTKVKEKMFPPGGLMPPDWMSKMAAENQKAYEQEFLIELRRILFSPRVARLSVPLLTLIIRDSAEYRLDKEPWSHSGPPRELRHLAASGFDSQCPLGILARPPTGKYLWIVSKFKECAIELKWNRRAAIEAEYPLMMPRLEEFMRTIMVQARGQAGGAPKRHKNVSIKEAALILGVSERTVKNWEAGKYTPEEWPGRADAIALRAFMETKKSRDATKRGLKNIVRGKATDSLPDLAEQARHDAWRDQVLR